MKGNKNVYSESIFLSLCEPPVRNYDMPINKGDGSTAGKIDIAPRFVVAKKLAERRCKARSTLFATTTTYRDKQFVENQLKAKARASLSDYTARP